MAATHAWGRAWHGRSYDLGRMTLSELWAAYATYPAIALYAALAVASSALAIATAGSWKPIALGALATLLVYPLVAYLVHRFILHGRWLYRRAWSAALWKRIHFDHHQDPDRLDVLFGAASNTLAIIAAVALPLGYAVGAVSGAAAAFAAGLVVICVHEFVHCIQHLNYMPKSRLLRDLKRSHLLHHFHDESGNYGILSFLPDRLLGTYYRNVRGRPRSATVYNLGYDLEEARRFPWVMNATGTPPHDGPPGPRTALTRSALRSPS